MTTITIELDPATGGGTVSIDGSDPAPFQSAEEVTAVIEQLAGQPDADEQAGFDTASAEAEQPQMRMAPKPGMAKPMMGGM